MPQLMIDTAAESPASLRLLAVLLTSYAALQEVADTKDNAATQQLGDVDAPPPASVIFGKTVTHAGAGAQVQNLPPVPQGTNVLPFPLPQVPTIQIPVTPAALPAVTDTPASVPVVVSPLAPLATVAAGTVSSELDTANIPWDARIHQSNRNKKADGTWMLKRGLDKTLAATVLAELTAAKMPAKPSELSPAAPAAGPVSLPLPPAPLHLPGIAQLPVAPSTMALPPPPVGASLPVVPAGLPATPVELFKAMMAKIGPALSAQHITQEQVNQAHTALGLPQLQLAITQPELIPHIEAALGL